MIRLFLLLLFLYTVKCDLIVSRSEGAIQIAKSMGHILNSFILGLDSHRYPRFAGYYGILAVNLMEFNASKQNKFTEPSVTFNETEQTILLNYPNNCLCLDFNTTAIQNLLIFTTSTYANIKTCLKSCTFKLSFKNPMGISFNFDVSNVSVHVYSKIIKAVGLGNTLEKALKLDGWKTYLGTTLQSLVDSTMVLKLKTMYENYITDLSCYSGKLNYTLDNRISKVMGNRSIVNYTKKGSMSNHISNPHLEYYFGHEFIKETYKAADRIQWNEIKLNEDSGPGILKKRLTADYFRQVVPDLKKTEPAKKFNITIKHVSSKLSIEFNDKAHQFEIIDLSFGITIEKAEEKEEEKKKFLIGEFTIKLVLEFILQEKSGEIRLLPSILKREVKVTKLESPEKYEVLKDGLKQIIEGALDDYYIKNYRDSTLCSGFMLTTIPENSKISDGKVHWGPKGINVTINY